MKSLKFLKYLLILITSLLVACSFVPDSSNTYTPTKRVLRIKTTAYCKCQKCCLWETNSKGQAIFSSGKLKGKLKIIGQTASGRMAKKGTIAADTRYFPFKTKMSIPGYGEGIVEDRGSAIKGYHLDLYFDTHQEALNWGVKYLDVTVYSEL